MMIKCVLFDMDWVLVDAKWLHRTAFLLALEHYWVIITPEFHDKELNALPTMKKLDILIQQWHQIQNFRDDIYALKQTTTLELIRNTDLRDRSKLLLIKHLKDKGYKIWVCSNSIRKSVDELLEKVWILEYFDLTISNQDVSKPKPDPEMYIQAMNDLWCSPDETIILEDSKVWIQAANDSWANVMEVSWVGEVTLESVVSFIQRINNLVI